MPPSRNKVAYVTGCVNIDVSWDTLTNAAYVLKFSNNTGRNWDTFLVLKETLKNIVPGNGRTYDDKTHHWYILEQFLDKVRKGFEPLVLAGVCKMTIHEKPQDVVTVIDTTDDDFETFSTIIEAYTGTTISKGATLSDAKRLYRKTASILHPDLQTGNAELMSQLNTVWRSLQDTNVFTKGA